MGVDLSGDNSITRDMEANMLRLLGGQEKSKATTAYKSSLTAILLEPLTIGSPELHTTLSVMW